MELHEIVVSTDCPLDAELFKIEYVLQAIDAGPYKDIEYKVFNNCVVLKLPDYLFKMFKSLVEVDKRIRKASEDEDRYYIFKPQDGNAFCFGDVVAAYK